MKRRMIQPQYHRGEGVYPSREALHSRVDFREAERALAELYEPCPDGCCPYIPEELEADLADEEGRYRAAMLVFGPEDDDSTCNLYDLPGEVWSEAAQILQRTHGR